MNLWEATATGNIEATQAILRKIRTAHLNEIKETTGLKDQLITKYAREKILSAEGRVISTVREKHVKDQQELEQNKLLNNNAVSIKNGPEFFLKNINNQIAEDGSNAAGVWKAEHNYTLGNIANGVIGPVEIEGIKNLPVTNATSRHCIVRIGFNTMFCNIKT